MAGQLIIEAAPQGRVGDGMSVRDKTNVRQLIRRFASPIRRTETRCY